MDATVSARASRALPQDRWPDSTLPLLSDPYRYLSRRCRELGTDAFALRFMLGSAIAISGPEAADLFADLDRFVRAGAAPGAAKRTLFGEGGVQTLDGEAHRHRKAMFLALVAPERVSVLRDIFARQWLTCAREWQKAGRVTLYDALHETLVRAVANWAGVPLPESDVARRTADITALFDGAGSLGWRHLRSRIGRFRSDRWIADLVRELRAGACSAPPGSVLETIAHHRELDGSLLPPGTAAVEILNILRPVTAISVYITLAAHALHTQPGVRERIAGDPEYTSLFVREVRRFYPFFPFVSARVRDDFEWHGFTFPKATLVLLDLHGTNHDPRAWTDPDAFRPERFIGIDPHASGFVPQGPGHPMPNHRCPGEGVTEELMKVAVDYLVNRMTYHVPEQDLEIEMTRLPALPRSRMRLEGIRLL